MKKVNLTSFKYDPKNANTGRTEIDPLIQGSLKKLGAGRSILVDKNQICIAGNKTLRNAIKSGMREAIVVKTKGEQLVIVQREDLDLSKDAKAKELSVADNRFAEMNLSWDPDRISQLEEEGVDLSDMEFEIAEPGEEKSDIETERLRSFKQVHVLISFPVALTPRIQKYIEALSEVEGIEIEQAAN